MERVLILCGCGYVYRIFYYIWCTAFVVWRIRGANYQFDWACAVITPGRRCLSVRHALQLLKCYSRSAWESRTRCAITGNRPSCLNDLDGSDTISLGPQAGAVKYKTTRYVANQRTFRANDRAPVSVRLHRRARRYSFALQQWCSSTHPTIRATMPH